MAEDPSGADRDVEIWKIKKLIQSLEVACGAWPTEGVTLGAEYIRPGAIRAQACVLQLTAGSSLFATGAVPRPTLWIYIWCDCSCRLRSLRAPRGHIHCLSGVPESPDHGLIWAPANVGGRDGRMRRTQNVRSLSQSAWDLTTEDPVQSSGTGEMDSFLQEIEELLQGFCEPHKEEAKTPAVPQPQLYVPLTTHGGDSQHGSTQSQVMPPLRPTVMTFACSNIAGTFLTQNSTAAPVKALDMPLGYLSETFSMSEKVTSFDQMKPTAGSQMAEITDIPRTSLTDCQKTTITASEVLISSEGSQMKTLCGDQTLSGNQMTTLCGDQMKTLNDNQILYGNQMAALTQGHVMTFCGDHTLTEGHTMTSSGDQMTNFKGGQMLTSIGNQTLYGDQMMTSSGDQTLYGSQMTTFGGDQILYEGQITASGGDQTLSGNQKTTFKGGQMMTSVGNQALHGGQMKTSGGEQTLSGEQMTTFKGDQMMTSIDYQTLYGGQMTTSSGDQTLYEGQMMILNGGHMTTFTDDHALYGSYMMSYPSLSLPYPGFLYFSSPHLIQAQLPEMQKCNFNIPGCQFQNNPDILKPYICTYQDCRKSYLRSSHLRIHERKHTGEKPYVCNVTGCTWKFSRSDELSRHKKTHSGERPYLCSKCYKNFARSDHLKQHQRIHR
ncbi:PREDICTED: uncharacterized protein LOC103588649 [Galeopterus variegatus]|uniref:Uncharacterized protein LOC103588649 n=1 Tax=Galeopterus variegatus TaxID=482537 RepID=A0ABM0QJT1_GALVR|nr:PREDICTED: uncharacterized protein LOC103588649 [Galeopterus variegatus]